MKAPLSVIVMTKNEEANLPDCLATLDFAAEIFVVDSASTDQTCAIAVAQGAKVIQFRWNQRWPKKKNWCLQNLPFSYPWVLFVDADERITPQLAQEIQQLLSTPPPYQAYVVRFDYVFLGKQLRFGDPVYKTILFQHELGQFEKLEDVGIPGTNEVEAHEQLVLANGTIGKLQGRIIHRDERALWFYFNRHNSYSSWDAYVRHHRLQTNDQIRADLFGSQPERRRFLKQLFLQLPLRPLVWFVYSYMFRLGFLDGGPGFHYNLCKALYHYQIDLKVYELEQRDPKGFDTLGK